MVTEDLCKQKPFTLLSTVQNYDESPPRRKKEKPFPVSALLSIHEHCWFVLLFEFWFSTSLKLAQAWGPFLVPPRHPRPPIFIPLYDGNTISSDRHWLRVEFFFSAMVWLRSQPSVKDKPDRKLNSHHDLQQPIGLNKIFMPWFKVFRRWSPL